MKNILIIIVLFPFFANAQLQLAKVFSDNMVLQRDQPIHLWGKGIPGKKLVAMVGAAKKTTVIEADSVWNIFVDKQQANSNPQQMIITCGEEIITCHNILIGDIWVCSGQSNMEWPLEKEMHFKDEIAQTNQPLIRLLNPPPAGRFVYGVPYTDSLNRRLNTLDFYQWNSWQNCDSNTSRPMSAIAYFFAKSIVTNKHIPIGIINLSIGGAPIETFISTKALLQHKKFAAKVQGNWLQNKNLPEWIRERAMQNLVNNPNGFKDELGLNHAYKPGFAFASGIEPLLNLPVKGIIWYQGESNSLELERVNEYKALMHLLIDDYRSRWKQPSMPFYWVQLSSIDTPYYKSQYWPIFRDQQRQLLHEVSNGGMAVCSDIGSGKSVHPTNKKDVGERLARWALKKLYGENICPSGPLPLAAQYADGRITISFKYASGITTSNGQPLSGISLDGKSELRATIQNNQVIIPVAEKPAFVYYGWKPFSTANLVNDDLLPASTFKIKVQ